MKNEPGTPGPWALDTMIFIYQFEAHPQYSSLTSKIFNKIEQGRALAFTSTITLMELCHKPYKLGNKYLVEYYRKIISDFPHLKVAEVNLDIAQYSAQLKAKYNLKFPDAIQLATGVVNGAKTFITNDQKLETVKEIKVLLLDKIN